MKATAKYLCSLNFELHVSNVVSFLKLQIIINFYQNSDIILAIAKIWGSQANVFENSSILCSNY